MKLFFTCFILFLSFLTLINTLYIYVDPREKKCLTKYISYNASFDVVYYVSGQQEEQNMVTIEDEKGNIFDKVYNKKYHKFSYNPKKDGELSFCFGNLASTQVTLNLEFDFGTNDYSMISIRTIENFVSAVDIRKKIKKITI